MYPLSEPVFERMNSLNLPSLHSLKTPVVWNEDVYALGRDSESDGKLHKYSPTSNEWSSFSVPSSIYASNSVLTTYNSKLLLINGKDMTLWEFTNGDFAFKESCIKPIPSTYSSQCSGVYNILATSSDKYLTIIREDRLQRIRNQLIYNGKDWKLRQLEQIRLMSGSSHNMVAIDRHAVFLIESNEWRNDVSILRALLMMTNFEENEDKAMAAISWEKLEMISLKEFDALLCGRKYSIIIQNQQFYCVDSKGIIFTTFLQSPIVPIVWGNSGVNFDQAPHLVGLPDGALLMIGTINNQDGSQLDVIKVSQKGNLYK